MTLAVVDVTRLMDNAVVRLPGALAGAIQLEVFNVLNDFFQNTNIWVEDIPFAVTTSNTQGSTEDIVPCAGVINRLLYVTAADGSQRKMSMPVPGEVMFIDVPSQSETWTARVAITVSDPLPKSGALVGLPKAPAWILAKYNNGILDGVLGSMMSQVAKPYSNIKMAALHTARYMKERSLASAEARRQNLYGGQRWSFPSGFASGSQRGGTS